SDSSEPSHQVRTCRQLRFLDDYHDTTQSLATCINQHRHTRHPDALAGRECTASDAYFFAHAKTSEYVRSFRSAWETLLLLCHGVVPTARASGHRRLERDALRKINLHWHDLRHEALSRLADEGVQVHELQLLAGHANITTTQRD